MTPNPFLGVTFHSIGGLAAASFYLPFRAVRHWSWESYWLVGGVFSWIIAPWAVAWALLPDPLAILRDSPRSSLLASYLFGVAWGLGGLTFGLSMRYLGMSLGYALALGMCAAFGTLGVPIYNGTIVGVVRTAAGWAVLMGVALCLAGIGISGLAGAWKERELSEEQKRAVIREFSFVKGVLVAVFAGLASACMSFGFSAGADIAATALRHGAQRIWQNLPVWIVVFAGGFTTNLLWCLALNVKNRSLGDYIGHSPNSEKPGGVRLLANYFFSAVAGITWYFQFFFYGMGAPLMGRFSFSSWSLHMASIIIFSSLWGICLREWKGTSPRTLRTVWIGVSVLVISMIVIGTANYKARL